MAKSSNTWTFTVPGLPVSQPRHRFRVVNGTPVPYLPKSHAVHAYKDHIRLLARQLFPHPLTGPLEVQLVFCFQAPRVQYHIKRPDVDNLVKSFLDACNGIAWQDDAQICRLSAAKAITTRSAHVIFTVGLLT